MILRILGINIDKKDEEIHFIIGTLTFLVVILLGVSIYYFADNFNILTNYLSDLGRSMVNGSDNTLSALFFTIAMFVGGLALLIFFLVSPEPLRKIESNVSILIPVGEITGIIGSIVMPLIGLVAVDSNQELHNTIGWIFFGAIGIAILSYSLFFIVSFLKKTALSSETLIFILIRIIGLALVLLLLELLTDFLGLLPPLSIDLLIVSLITLSVVIIFVFTLAKNKLKSFFGFLSYSTSLFMIGLIIIIVIFIYTSGLQAYIEIILVSAIILWAFTNNARAFFLSLET